MFVCAECGASQPVPGRCSADGSELAPVGDDRLLGTTIGAYRVARLLGVGGMGRVYKGVHPQIGSRVAIKVLSRECSDRRDLVERFFAEAKAVNLIRHESIVNVLDLSTLPDGRPYIVMEYLDGAPLADIVEHAQRAGTPLSLGGLARLVAEVLDALGAAHAKGIVHRDLKPDNIFVTPAGRAKVLDFGIAKLQPELGGSATHTGSLLGTPHYMSPEQAAGRHVDLRADIYAIGVILFECATLQRPFVADSLFDLLRKHVEQPPPSARALRPDMPEALEQLILTALAKAPEQRFASAQAMSTALQHATQSLSADQWAPITPAHGRTGTWQPTPPAGWGSQPPSWGTAQRPPDATPSAAPAPTQKSGTAARLAVLLAGALVGVGAIAAMMIARGGENESPAVAVAEPAGSADTGSAESGSAVAETTEAQTTPESDERAEGSGSAATPTPETAADDEDDDAAEDDDSLDEDAIALMDEAVGEMLDNLDPSAKAMISPEIAAALKKYGRWSKIPKAERAQLLAKLTGVSADITAKAMQALASTPGPGKQVPAATTQQGTSPPASSSTVIARPNVPGLDANGWVVSRRFQVPGYDTKRLSIEKYLPIALAEAKKLVPDAVLFRIDADGVHPDGHADITLASHGSLDFRFISPKRSKRDPNLPLGAKQEYKCMFRIMFDDQGGWSAPIPGQCNEPLLGPPKCTSVQIWKKALARGAPRNAIAELGYRGWNKRARWYFTIEGTKFSQMYHDDC